MTQQTRTELFASDARKSLKRFIKERRRKAMKKAPKVLREHTEREFEYLKRLSDDIKCSTVFLLDNNAHIQLRSFLLNHEGLVNIPEFTDDSRVFAWQVDFEDGTKGSQRLDYVAMIYNCVIEDTPSVEIALLEQDSQVNRFLHAPIVWNCPVGKPTQIRLSVAFPYSEFFYSSVFGAKYEQWCMRLTQAAYSAAAALSLSNESTTVSLDQDTFRRMNLSMAAMPPSSTSH